ncbi:MAG: M15 family metallopeptidase, partial [Bacteroidales bacterium]|nr:M15 family metallopeptidase [Bacteroidales bacterium]
LKIGESVFLSFISLQNIKYIQLDAPSMHCSYKLYLDEKYAGRFDSNQKIGVDKLVKSIRILVVASDLQRIVHGWDNEFNYLFIKDTSENFNSKQNIILNIDTKKEFLNPLQPKKGFESYSINTNHIKKMDIFDKMSLLVLHSKKKQNIYEQVVNFKKDGTFFINQVCVNGKTKKVTYDFFFTGKWKLLKQLNNNYQLDLLGKFSGVMPEKIKISSTAHHTVCLIDSLSVIHLSLPMTPIYLDLPDWVMVNVDNFNDKFIIQIPYASEKNITGIKLYPCSRCFLLYHTVKDLLKAQQMFEKKGLKIKLLDCYRPKDVQQILYDAFPVSGYVADPVGGSIHNRGTAVDLTLVDKQGKELDMGTPFDDLTYRSNHGYIGFSDTILNNRKLLRETMNACNFVTIRLEWWHYNHLDARKYPKLNDPFPCNDK